MRRVLAIVARVALAVVFLYAAYAKLKDPWVVFAMEIDAMKLVPDKVVEPVARFVPWFELAIGVLLLIGIQTRYVAPVATLMLATFLTILFVLYLRGFQGDCGCFGPGEQLGPKTLARDGSLVLLSAWVTWEAFRGRGADRSSRG